MNSAKEMPFRQRPQRPAPRVKQSGGRARGRADCLSYSSLSLSSIASVLVCGFMGKEFMQGMPVHGNRIPKHEREPPCDAGAVDLLFPCCRLECALARFDSLVCAIDSLTHPSTLVGRLCAVR